jgi:uncharacterized repeat protein (TIGR03803 family)
MRPTSLKRFSIATSFLALLCVAAAPAQAQSFTENVLYNFCPQSGCADGEEPYAGLIMDASDNLYGTTYLGGANGYGAVFELVNSSGTYSEKVLYSFTNSGGDGALPLAGLIMDASGNLYGTTAEGGASGYGTVFELVNSSGTYSEKVLYSFTNSGGDGAYPYAGLIMDASGNLYGTTYEGGLTGSGTVFELVNSSGAYSEKVLYSFTGSNGDGADPEAGLIMDASGNLYGTTEEGGASGYGTVFELVNSSGTYSEKVLYGFTASNGDGAIPYAGLLMDASGNLYGTTESSGNNPYDGTVFELVNSSGSYSENVLYTFTGSDGAYPYGGLIMNASGTLYGTTRYGGTNGAGVVFSLSYTTSLLISSNLNPSTYGQAATFTATISNSDSGDLKRRNKRKAVRPQAITGTVTWSANTGCGTTQVTGSPATATCTTSSLPAGNNTITATYSGDDEGSASTLSGGQVVNQASQTISCSGIPSSAAYGSGFTASCSASSGLPVNYASSGGCSNAGASYSMTSGTTACSVIVTQTGNGNYLAAPAFNQSVTATRINPTVSFTGLPSSLAYNSTYTLSATTNDPSATVDITNSTPTVCSLTSDNGTTMTLLIVADIRTCSLTAMWPSDSNYNGTSLTQSGTATKGQAIITWATPAPIYYGTALSSTQLDATASPANIYTTPVYSPVVGKIEAAGNLALKVTFAAHGNTDYGTTTDTVTLQVLPAATTTTVTPPDQSVTLDKSGTASATVDFNVSSYKPTGTVTLTTTPAGPTCTGTVAAATGNGHCKLTFDAANTYTINASYQGDANHTGSDNSSQSPAVTVTVNPYP